MIAEGTPGEGAGGGKLPTGKWTGGKLKKKKKACSDFEPWLHAVFGRMFRTMAKGLSVDQYMEATGEVLKELRAGNIVVVQRVKLPGGDVRLRAWSIEGDIRDLLK